MTSEESQALIDMMRQKVEELIAEGPAACLAFLVKAGICNTDGTLAEPYKTGKIPEE